MPCLLLTASSVYNVHYYYINIMPAAHMPDSKSLLKECTNLHVYQIVEKKLCKELIFNRIYRFIQNIHLLVIKDKADFVYS